MRFGFIGCGKMATALVQGTVESGAIPRRDIVIFDCLSSAAATLAERTGVEVARSPEELVNAADVLVICVKPDDVSAALRNLNLEGKLIISIVAGLPLSTLQGLLGKGRRIIRVMPNSPALIHRGAAAFALSPDATADDGAVAERIFGAVGKVFEVKEELLNAVTGLSGSGPAYVYLMIEALADGGVLMGLPRQLALELAAQTVAGSAEMVLRTGEHPAALRDLVASPGGTTIAALEVLEARGVRGAFLGAVRAATERAQALGRGK